MIEPFAFLVALWKLQTFFTPRAFNFLMIDAPTLDALQLGSFMISTLDGASLAYRAANPIKLLTTVIIYFVRNVCLSTCTETTMPQCK